MPAKDYSSTIELYLDNKMSEQERTAFEEELKKNTSLAKELKIHQLERLSLDFLVEREDKSKINQWLEESEKEHTPYSVPSKSKQKRLYKIVTSVAASLLLIICLSLLLRVQYSNERIMNAYYIDPTNELLSSFANVEDDSNKKRLINEAKVEFNNGNFKQSIQSLSSIPTLDESSHYFLAHSFFKAKDYPNAILNFKNVLLHNGPLREKSELYLLLCYLANDQIGDDFQFYLQKNKK